MKRLLIVTTAALAALGLAGCGAAEDGTGSGGSGDASSRISLTDATGTEVTLDAPATKVVGLEWNVVEDLQTLGVAPAGVAELDSYNDYDKVVPLSGSPVDVGTRSEPSTDAIAKLAPDLIVGTTDYKAATIAQLRRIAPTLIVTSADAEDQLATAKQALDLVARATGKDEQADRAWSSFEDTLAEDKKKLAAAGKEGQRTTFADAYVESNQVTVRPYTTTSEIGAVNEALGLENAWDVEGDPAYGLGATDIEGLTRLGNVQFLYIANDADGGDPFADRLAKNAVWKALPFVTSDQVHRLPDGIWTFGGPASMAAYADAATAAITG